MIAVLDECREAGVELGAKDPPPEDLALLAWLADPNILQRVHAEQYRARPEKFESFFTDRTQLPDFMAPSEETLKALEHDLNEWFEFKKKGRGVRVFPFIREDGVWLLIRHGQRIRREGTVEADEQSGSIFYRPEKYDVLVYYPAEGELAVNTETVGERRAYCRFLGRHLFGDDSFFRAKDPRPRYTLYPLMCDGRRALACRDVEGLESVTLVELHIARESEQCDVEIRRAGDVLLAFEHQGRQLLDEQHEIQLVRAKFRVRFSGGRERTIIIEPPNVASFDRNSDNAVIHDWLCRRGFIIGGGEVSDADSRILLEVH
jgi:hypothetical protein